MAKKTTGRPKGSRNVPKRQGFYKLSPEQIVDCFADAPFIPVSKDWLLKQIGDGALFDAFFSASTPEPTQSADWNLQEL